MDMLRDENGKSKAYVSCLGVLKELGNFNLRFRGFKDKNTLHRMYLKVKNNN